MNIYRHVYAIVGLGIVLAALSVASPSIKAKAPSTQNVFVTNTASNPVPVAVNGTANISGTVNIGNNSSAPIPVVEVTAAQRIPKTFETGIYFNTGATDSYNTFYTVPDGKVLVVQSVTVQSFQMPAGEHMISMGLGALYAAQRPIVIGFQGNDFDGYPLFVGNFTGTMRFGPGSQVRVYGIRDSGTGACGGEAVVEGYLENA